MVLCLFLGASSISVSEGKPLAVGSITFTSLVSSGIKHMFDKAFLASSTLKKK